MSDTIRKMLEQQDALRRLTDPISDIMKTHRAATEIYGQVGAASEAMRLFKADEERRKMLSSMYDGGAVGRLMREMDERRKPIEQARQLGLLDPASDFRSSLATISAEHERYRQSFALPATTEIERLARQALGTGTLAESVFAASGRAGAVEEAMRAMRSPWLNVEHELRSTRAFGDLLGIGRGVAALPPYAELLTQGLRPSLGDWRDPITLVDAWQDPILRSGFYRERGFDPALTDFTREGFAEAVEAAGLMAAPADDSGDEEAEGLARSREAFARLQELERAIRRFIMRVMEAAFGPDWMGRQLPAGMLDAWTAKRDKAVQDGLPAEPLINYADFTEYKAIIERRDNWSTVFKPVFGRAEDVRESFQRMFPLRIATMHARLITSDDELLLLVETSRIMRAIRL